MAKVECPACGDLVKFREYGERVRCTGCGKSFRPRDEDDEDDEDEEDEPAPRARRPRKRARSRSSTTKTTALIAGGLILLVLLGFGIVLLVRKSGTDGGTDGGGSQSIDRTKVTIDNFKDLKEGMTLADIEAVLGGSRSSSLDDLRDALRRGSIDRSPEELAGTAGGVLSQITVWRRWEGVDLRVWVGFLPTKDGPRAAYATSLLSPAKGGAYQSGFVPHNAEQIEQKSEDRKKEQAIRSDPKWVRGAKARELLLGEWREHRAHGFVFGAGGTLTDEWYAHVGPPATYTADERFFVITHPSSFPGQPATTIRYEYFVNEDELALIARSSSFDPPILLYRMPVRAGSPGEKQLLLPLIAALKSGDQITTLQAYDALSKMGKGAVIVLPALIGILGDPNLYLVKTSAGLISNLKDAAVPAVPALVRLLWSPDPERVRVGADALEQIGPPAKDALPALRAVVFRTQDFHLKNAAQGAINKIEGRKF